MIRFSFISLLAGLSLFSSEILAISSQDINFEDFRNGTIGVMVATFDPVTEDHRVIIERALEPGSFSKIVVIPSDFTPTKPLRTYTPERHEMLTAAFATDKRIITLDPYENGFPQSRHFIHKLQKEHGIKVIGVVLAPDLKSRFHNYLLNKLIPANELAVLFPYDFDTDKLPSTFGSAAVHLWPAKMPPSSEITRSYLKTHPELYESMDAMMTPTIQTLPLCEEVRKIIFKNSTYSGHREAFGMTRDFYHSYFW